MWNIDRAFCIFESLTVSENIHLKNYILQLFYIYTKAMNFKIQSGLNLSHWLSQDQDWVIREKLVTEKDIEFIKSMGFDHVRLPVDEEIMWHEDGTPNEESFAYATSCIEFCEKYGLRIILDMHILRSHHFNAANDEGAMTLWDDPKEQEKLLQLWAQLSERFRKYSNDLLAYEFMNEPVAPEHEQWNQLLNRGISFIRSLEPERILIAGSNMWQKTWTYPYFEVPEDDPNIILSFHVYEPILFTHYKADWLPSKVYEGPVQYPGISVKDEWIDEHLDPSADAAKEFMREENGEFNKEVLEKRLQPVLEKAKKHKLPLLCSEFGCLPTVDRKSRMQFFSDLISLFRKYDIAHTMWEYKADFGIAEMDGELAATGYDQELAKLLTE